MSDVRVQFSLRLSSRDKERFSAAAERCGLDPSAAARQLIELVVQRIDAGGDFIDALHELKTVWGVPKQSELEVRLEGLAKALASFRPPEDQSALVDKIEAVEREMLQHTKRRA
jgi:hypothetical protein